MGGCDGDDVKSLAPIFVEAGEDGERVVGAVVGAVVGGVACDANTNGCGDSMAGVATSAGWAPHVAQALTGTVAGAGACGVESDNMVSRSWPACCPWPC